MKLKHTIIIFISVCLTNALHAQIPSTHPLQPVPINAVTIDDPFWSPKYETWTKTTVRDVLDKFENDGAMRNYDRVAGLLDGSHEGPPWFDGLIYETIRGISDLLISYPDKEIEARLDDYIKRIRRAQDVSGNGYIMTYTQLDEPKHKWGLNGGFLRLQHDIYDSGALVEAGVHHYRATGKVSLLTAAVKLANHMVDELGPAPKKNVIPAHSLSEEALVDLYRLFKNNPTLADKLDVPVNTDAYLDLAEFWIEYRGRHAGYPTTHEWDNNGRAAEKWVRDQKYGDSRPSWGEYGQDHCSVFQQDTLEGHAVRATLFAAGVTAAASENNLPEYIRASSQLWDNMVGRRMHLTGGVGAFAHEEKFGPDYVLPNDAYLETCAVVGAGFFHHNMNLLMGQAKYVDELERALYNNVINGISLSGDHYYYRNPLTKHAHHRWNWHGCPCCPPMFLKFIGSMPGYIYATDDTGVYVNLFIGSQVTANVNNQTIKLKQTTAYPYKGDVNITVDSDKPTEYTIYVRIPGWAVGKENPFDLYTSKLDSTYSITVNGKSIANPTIERGYAAIHQTWKKGDTIKVTLPVQPRRIYAHDAVEADKNRVALQAGPLVYCLESIDNPTMQNMYFPKDEPLSMQYKPNFLGGINIITAPAKLRMKQGPDKDTTITAIPFYIQDNRPDGGTIDVWLPEVKTLVTPKAADSIANQAIPTCSHCFGQDTVAAINDDLEPKNSDDHSIPRHTWWDHKNTQEWVQYDFAQAQTVSSCKVYWWNDTPSHGECNVPKSWTVSYRDNDGHWVPVKAKTPYTTLNDQYNEVTFQPVTTTALRITVQLQKDYSSGVLEWQVH